MKLWGSTGLWMTLRWVKTFFENLRFFRFFCLKSVFFYNNIIIIIPKKTVFWTLLGEFLDLLVETLGFDGHMDDFKRGKNIFFLKIYVFSVSFASNPLFLGVILAPKSENRSSGREAAIFRERSEPQASRSDARARRARAKHGKAAKRPFRAAKRRFEPRSGSCGRVAALSSALAAHLLRARSARGSGC